MKNCPKRLSVMIMVAMTIAPGLYVMAVMGGDDFGYGNDGGDYDDSNHDGDDYSDGNYGGDDFSYP